VTEYLVDCNGKRAGFQNIREALEYAFSSCTGGVSIYKAVLVMRLTRDELDEVRQLVSASQQASREAAKPEEPRECIAVVFDQMFRGFAEVVDRELKGLCVELHEVVGRGLEKTVRVTPRLYREPAHDDYDVLSLAERLARRGKVVLFTGDRRLADQARMIPGVYVEYIPPGEFGGKEMTIKHMVQVVRSVARGDETPR
jgi:hypothetical protein